MNLVSRVALLIVLAASLIGPLGCDRGSRVGQSTNSNSGNTGQADKSNDAQPLWFQGHTASIRFMTFSADGMRLLTISSGQVFKPSDGKLEEYPADDKSARVWDVHSGKEIARFDRHENGVECGALSPDGALAATADGTHVRVWAVSEAADQKHDFNESKKKVVAVAFSADGAWLAAADEEGMVRIWDLSSGNPLAAWQQRSVPVRGLVFSPDRKYLAGISQDGLEVWDPAASVPLREIQQVSALAAGFGPDSRTLLMLIKYDATERPAEGAEVYHHGVVLHEWDVDSGQITSHDPLIGRGVEQAALAADGSRFIVGGLPLNGDMLIQVYDVGKKREAGRFDVPHPGGLCPEPSALLAVAPGGRQAAIAVYRKIDGDRDGPGNEPAQSRLLIDRVRLYDLPE